MDNQEECVLVNGEVMRDPTRPSHLTRGDTDLSQRERVQSAADDRTHGLPNESAFNLNFDLSTGGNPQLLPQQDTSTPQSSVNPSGKRLRNSPGSDSSSNGSFFHAPKKTTLVDNDSLLSLQLESVIQIDKHNIDAVPKINEEATLWDKNDLEWYNESVPSLYTSNSPAPFVVLVESTIRGRNIGKLDPICVIDLLTPLIHGKKLITRNGQNQVKVVCDFWQSANDLAQSRDLVTAGYRAIIPDSFLRKKGFTTWFPWDRSVKDIVRVCSSKDLESIASIRRLVNEDNTIQDKIEFTFESPTVPRYIQLGEFMIQITPSIQHPRRCFRCQRFCHDMNQCRSTYPSCEFCAGRHLTRFCPNGHLPPKCKNCKGLHLASSSECPVYKFEFGILKHRYSTNCNRDEAKLLFFSENPDLTNRVTAREESFSNSSNDLPANLNIDVPKPTFSKNFQIDEVTNTDQDQVIQISKDMSAYKIDEKLQAVNSLIDLNDSRSALIDSLQENLISPLKETHGASFAFLRK
ncbi:uncharacterized protein LOC127286194 [Leptopilina boulardi]|uniref:uncharacterized protein LOC127286194 n=1 Tax=Leptopilina boulardi TaxID=63433 RepID=UPI0021F5815D|nr:uncharacterized protein LOC127286194 [Leptopilina boulardi]